MPVSLHVRPMAPPLSSLQLKQYLQCKQVAVTACTTRCVYDLWLFRLSPLQLKKYLQCKQVAVVKSMVNASAVHCMYIPCSASFVSCQTPKITCSACTLLSLHIGPRLWALSVCSSTERKLQQWMQVSSHVRRVRLLLVSSATQKNTCSASRWLSLHVWAVCSICLFFKWKQMSTVNANAITACTTRCLLHFEYMRKQHLAVMSKWQKFFFAWLLPAPAAFTVHLLCSWKQKFVALTRLVECTASLKAAFWKVRTALVCSTWHGAIPFSPSSTASQWERRTG